MKIVHIVESFGGGVYEFLRLLTQKDKMNEHMIIFSRREETPFHFEQEFKKVTLVEVKMQRSISLLKDFNICKSISGILKDCNPDIVHLHSSKAGAYGRLINLFRFKKYKMIYNPHGLSFLRVNESKIKRTAYLVIEKLLCFISKTVIVGVSNAEYNKIARYLSHRQARHINNGIVSSKQVTSFSEIRYDFATVGRICEQKNPSLFNTLALNYPERRFLWIGDGDQRYLLTAPNIEVTGWISSKKEVIVKLMKSRIYTQLSKWEGLPLALLEAMSLGLPCLVTPCEGIQEIIEVEQNGQVIDFSLNGIDKQINEIEVHYNDYSVNSRQAVLEKYSVKIMVEKYQKLYVEVSG